MGAYKVKGSGGMPQYEAGSDGKCFNIRQGVRRRTTFGVPLLLRLKPAKSSDIVTKPCKVIVILRIRNLVMISANYFDN